MDQHVIDDPTDARVSIVRDLLAPADRKKVPAPPVKGVTFKELQPHHCRWPLGDDPKHPDFRFCENRRLPGKSYCEQHVRAAYQARPQRTQGHMILPALDAKLRT